MQIQERRKSQEILLDRLNQLAAKTAAIATVRHHCTMHTKKIMHSQNGSDHHMLRGHVVFYHQVDAPDVPKPATSLPLYIVPSIQDTTTTKESAPAPLPTIRIGQKGTFIPPPAKVVKPAAAVPQPVARKSALPAPVAPPPAVPVKAEPLAGPNVMKVVMVGAECAPWSKTGKIVLLSQPGNLNYDECSLQAPNYTAWQADWAMSWVPFPRQWPSVVTGSWS